MISDRRRTMFALAALLLFAATSAAATDLDEALVDAPQEIHDIIAAAQGPLSEGEFLILGRATFADGRTIEGNDCGELYVAFQRGVDIALGTFRGGWFATEYSVASYYAEGGLLLIRAEGHAPVDVPIDVPTDATGEDRVVIVDDVMLRPESGFVIRGVVEDPDGEPIEGLEVDLTFPLATYCYEPLQAVRTDTEGAFEFTELCSAEFHVQLGAPYGYVAAWRDVMPDEPNGENVVLLVMHPELRVIVDYAYQPDGTRTLTGPGLVTGTAIWDTSQGFDFEDGGPEYYEQEDLRDLELEQDGGELYFRNFYITGENGHYQVEGAAFEDVSEAAESGYGIRRTLCVVGGVYVIRTYTENCYAKLVVRIIEPVF